MSGKCISAEIHREWFAFLEDEEHFADVSRTFAEFGLRLVKTANGRTWYAAWKVLDANTRAHIERVASEHKKEYRHFITFFRLVLMAMSHGHIPQAGDCLRESAIVEVVQNNSNLVDRLKLLCSRIRTSNKGGDSIPVMVASVVNWAKRKDLLEDSDPSRNEYRFTGKVDWVNDMNEAFRECIDMKVEAEDKPETMSLF